jgi:hypothetical protein
MNSKLQKAIEQDNLQAVVTALDSGADIEASDIHGDPGLPLRTACFKGHAAIVLELLRRGVNIHAPNAQGPGAPVRMAARGEHSGIISLLVEHGAEPPLDHKSSLADDQKPSLADVDERRQRSDRRGGNYGPPKGLKERRCSQERRVTSVQELELSDFQWTTYFARSREKAAQQNDAADMGSMIFARVRD